MKQKVILISIDGMRPDGFLACNHPFIHEMMKLGAYTLSGRTVFPSVTLPSGTPRHYRQCIYPARPPDQRPV